jgi:DhnA family fructose-bisphosphate aldolase class Ia
MFHSVDEAVSIGVALGRNVKKYSDPKKVAKALVDIVHHGK